MALEYISDSTTWQGEPIDGIKHPLIIEYLWSDVELAAIGLQKRQEPAPPPPTQAELLEYAGYKRYQTETGGTTVSGYPIATDIESQTKIIRAFIRAKNDAGFTIANWRLADGSFVSLTNNAILVMGDGVHDFIQSCDDAEKAVRDEILADTITTFAEIDQYAWPT